jgi:hypothetical protein
VQVTSIKVFIHLFVHYSTKHCNAPNVPNSGKATALGLKASVYQERTVYLSDVVDIPHYIHKSFYMFVV